VTRPQFKRQEIPVEARHVIEQYNALDRELYTWASERFAALLERQGVPLEREVRMFQQLNGLCGRAALLARQLKGRTFSKR
jgi:hypothetical protein